MPQQLRLLLWKDYLTRRRKPITLAGIVWATAIFVSIYIVRTKIDNLDFPTCQFPARALPSAGMLPFLQSFICSVNNECETMDKFDEIPTYENSKLTQLQRKFSPLLYNETILEVAGAVPDALKLLSKLADIVDEPTFIDISKNGLKVRDLFSSPSRVKRYLSSKLSLEDDVIKSVMSAELSFQGILKGNLNRCNPVSISETLAVNNTEHLKAIADKLCNLTDQHVQKILMDLLVEVDFHKFITMIGNMYEKLSGDERVTSLADTVTAVLRMMRLNNFLPREVLAVLTREQVDFSYFDLELTQKFVDLFEPTFGDTESFNSIKDFADTIVMGLKYLNQFVSKAKKINLDDKDDVGLKSVNKALGNAVEVFEETIKNENSIDVFNVLAQITKFVNKWLPNDTKHEVLLYSTLLTKLIEGATKVISINMNIEQRTYNVASRHPDGVQILVGLPSDIIAKGFEGLTDAERIQVMTSKINNPGQMFCDLNRLQGFFKISKEEATSLRTKLCTDPWKNLVSDMIRSFGIYDVKDNINAMASLLIQETLGKDTSDQLYTFERDFQVLKNFTHSLTRITEEEQGPVNWIHLFNVSEQSEFMKTIRSKAYLGKQMLVTVHGALAKEVVNQNPILSYKINPGLIDATTLVVALNEQLNSSPEQLVNSLKEMYPGILETVVRTALVQNKTYKSLSTHSVDIMCHGVDGATDYLELPTNVDREKLINTMCNISVAIENGLEKDSIFGKALAIIRTSDHKTFNEVEWTTLINGLKNVYVKLERDFPYLFEYNSYGLDAGMRGVLNKMVGEAKRFWFGGGSLGRSMHLGLKMAFRVLDLVDREVFNVTSSSWLLAKYSMYALSAPLTVADDFVNTVAAIYRNESYRSELPASTVAALQHIVPNVPQLLTDGVNIVIDNHVELEPIISLLNAEVPWPCSGSLSELLPMSAASAEAIMALETILCMDQNFTQEWTDYLGERNVTIFDIKNYNKTTFPPHVFLKFSSAVDGLIDDVTLVKAVIDDVIEQEDGPWMRAWRVVVDMLRRDDRDVILRNFFSKVDTALSSVSTPPFPSSVHALWAEYLSCEGVGGAQCSALARAAWKRALQFVATTVRAVTDDLMLYFTETNGPNSNLLQVLGFTRGTPLYELYDKLPEFVGVLIHSYFDFGFMSEIRRAALTQFWDCEAVLEALVIPPYSSISKPMVGRIKPYVCVSFLYWLGLPRDDNKLLDVVAKPNYYFFTLPAENFTSNFEDAYTNVINLTNLFTEIANKNVTLITEEDIKANTIQYKFEKLVDRVLNYRINETDPFYINFYEGNKKYFASSIYLTRIVSIVNKAATAIDQLNANNTEINAEEKVKLEADLKILKKSFKRRPVDIIALHFDILTDLIWKNDKEYTLVDAVESTCRDLSSGDSSKTILVDIDNKRVKNQICSKNYKVIYKAIENDLTGDYEDARFSLLNLVKILQSGDENNVTDIFEFINQRKQLVSSLKASIKHSYELSIPPYLQYLQSNLRHYDVIMSFLAGQDWWSELRAVYNGPRAKDFFDSVELSFEMVEDVFNGFDRIHLVRLLRDINVNSSDAFCSAGVVLGSYLPDGSGRLSRLKQEMCDGDKTLLFKELPPLLFASQGYETSLSLSRDINNTALQMDLTKAEANLDLISKQLRSPQRPQWVTEDKIKHLKKVAVNLLSRDSLTRVAFGVLSNVADGGTLFLNMSQCTVCSQLTSWLKQLNLQVFKKQEYDGVLCRMADMTLGELKAVLQNDFHWDMAIRELIQTRNYTKNELNKSLNEFLEQIKLHLLDDMNSGTAKLADCLVRNVTRNAFGNVTLFISILSHTSRLLRAETPHLQEIEGVTSLPYLKKIAEQIAPRLDVYAPLNKYLLDKSQVEKEMKKFGAMGKDILDAEINLRLVSSKLPVTQYVKLHNKNWVDVCKEFDCTDITNALENKFDQTMVDKNLPSLQKQEFWRFPFVSRILYHIEQLLSHAGRVLAVMSHVDVGAVMEGRLPALVDLLMEILMDDVAGDIIYSLQGLVEELQPVVGNTTLEHDLRALATGLTVLVQFKTYLLKEMDLKFEVSELFSYPERVEYELGKLGINNTNFWSIAAPRIHAGQIDLKPLFTPRQEFHIASYVCDIDTLSTLISPASLEAVTKEDVSAAVVDQFCGISDETAMKMVQVLIGSFNLTTVVNKVANILLPQLYTSVNLTREQGAAVLAKYPQMASLLPVIQSSVGDLGDTIAKEPLVQSLKESSNLGGLLGSPDFLANVGRMLCGKPLPTDMNRFYKAIVESKDFSQQVDQEQLDALPTDFCRDLYKQITSMGGGKIVWSFVKPLVMGKILYTPASPLVERIIAQANSTFAHMIKLTSLIHSFSESFPSLDDLSAHRAGVSSLRRVLGAPALGGLLGNSPLPDVNADSLFDDFGDIRSIGSLLKRASDLLQCFDLNRFRAVPDEFQLTHEAVKLSRVNEFSAGLVFQNTEGKSDIKNIQYKIRMDIENAPTTTRMKNYLWIPGPESIFIENMRYFRGFVQIQDLIGDAIIQLSRSNSTRSKRETSMEDKWNVYTQQEPYPCYRKDFFQTSLYESQSLMVALFFSLLFTVASTVRFIVADKESGNTMLMSVMGVNLTYHTISWFLSSLLELAVTVALVTAVLHWGSILPNTSPTVVAAILLVFAVSVLAFCYMVSKAFETASVAAVCSAIAYLVSFMPFVLILSLEAVLGYGLKLVVCLSMSTSICYAFLNITRAEARGVGTSWADIWRTDDGDLSIFVGCAMALLDAAIYTAIGMALDRYYGPKTQSSITNCKTSGEKAGVSVINITKVYNQGGRREKLALDNVSIELHKGQITTLLGHNGAGKTTLINILTGMLKPTKGHIIVRSDYSTHTQVGVCPQKDVLFEALTAAEHVALYAQLKSGLPLEMVKDEVDSMVSVLSLGAVAGEPVWKLSGGTRRRLCVALAFVARPPLVSLDEPTAGVDPAARRDIWSMIVKLREGRTILLTTHHLDEAELLSDQIVIMHKGQVHTSGSPIDIKRSLGTGYRLSVSYERREGARARGVGGDEERAQALLDTVRAVVPNAGLLRATGPQLVLAVPFYDDNGLNNDFLRLCSELEDAQQQLCYSSYTLDCSSLEQVFFTITNQTSGEYEAENASKSASTSSVQSDHSPLVAAEGPVRGPRWAQLLALLHARYMHYIRNRWLLFLLLVLPSLFVTIAMAFSTIRPPADNELALPLTPRLYPASTAYLVPDPTVYSNIDPTFARRVLEILKYDGTRKWTPSDTPNCTCSETKQVCEPNSIQRPAMMEVPDVNTLNEWIVASHDDYIEKRYGGFTAALKNNMTYLVAWYNNKGHHAMPAYLNSLHNALLRSVSGDARVNITVSSHPLKISEEQLSKDTVYQHIADAGISGLVLVAYALVSGGAAVYLVGARTSQQKRLQLLCGVSPLLYWGAALIADMTIIVINMVITVIVFKAFGFPVFVARNNLPAICLLILLYGFACGSFVHVMEKLFTEASLANMILFCGNAFVGLAGITLLLILDIISESETTENARWTLHKILLMCPQFVLADGMLEIAKNTVQAQVLIRFGMDTYKDPLSTDLIMLHYLALTVVGTALFLINLAIEYDCFQGILARFRSEWILEKASGEMEELEVGAERRRVRAALCDAHSAVRLPTLGNINAGFVDTEVKNNSIKRIVCAPRDVAACVQLTKAYSVLAGTRVAVRNLTLGIPPGQCTALLGQNGAGKSTTFAMLTGQTRPTAGQIYLNDKRAHPRQLCKGLISYCPQSDAIDPLLTVRETLQLYCKLRGIEDQDEVISRTMCMFDLSKYAAVRSGALSGGNKRKLCAALAFMGRTPLVLLDEPTSGMDPGSRACVSRGVQLATAWQRAVLLSTHALDDARRLCARVALMKDGELCALAPLDDCLKRFGGGYIVACRCGGDSRSVWRAVKAAAPHAKLRVLHHSAIHFLIPTVATVNEKEVTTTASDIFRLMARLQTSCDIEDYTLNQTSLDQMFLSFTEKGDEELDPTDLESLPTIEVEPQNELNSITPL